MSDLTILTASGSYQIQVGAGVAASAIAGADLLIVDPAATAEMPSAGTSTIELIGSEESKTLESCGSVLVAMRESGLRRGDVVVAVGGGVIQDVATLVSSLYMRGVPWIYVPTTVMAMVDSCVGGKSSINAGGIKNLVGNVYPPVGIAVDTNFVATLPPIAVAAGLCEAVKICFCGGTDPFEKYLALAAGAGDLSDTGATARLFRHVLETKKWFVEIDEFDRRERQQLNFGHSFGHAFEAATNFALPHGIAVGIGMVAATEHPRCEGGLSAPLLAYVKGLLKPYRELIATTGGQVDWPRFRSALEADKKNGHGVLRLILPAASSPTATVELGLTETELEVCEQSMARALEDLTR